MPVVHELTTLEIRVFSNAGAHAALEKHLPAAGGKLLGAFATDIGELSRVPVRASSKVPTRWPRPSCAR